MKKIIINDWLVFVNMDKPQGLVVEPAYRAGYWNVMRWNEELEKFLIENKIDHKVTEEPLL